MKNQENGSKPKEKKPEINVLELKKENQELKRKLEEFAKLSKLSFEEKINYYEEKQRRINALNIFEVKLKDVLKAKADISKLIDEKAFEQSPYVFKISNGEYRDDVIVKISNPEIVLKSLCFVEEAIKDKIEILKLEISE